MFNWKNFWAGFSTSTPQPVSQPLPVEEEELETMIILKDHVDIGRSLPHALLPLDGVAWHQYSKIYGNKCTYLKSDMMDVVQLVLRTAHKAFQGTKTGLGDLSARKGYCKHHPTHYIAVNCWDMEYPTKQGSIWTSQTPPGETKNKLWNGNHTKIMEDVFDWERYFFITMMLGRAIQGYVAMPDQMIRDYLRSQLKNKLGWWGSRALRSEFGKYTRQATKNNAYGHKFHCHNEGQKVRDIVIDISDIIF